MIQSDTAERARDGLKTGIGWWRANTALLAVALVLSLAAVGTIAVVALTPAVGLPIGVATADGPSMGDEGTQVVVHADVAVEEGDVIVFEANDRFVRHRVVGEASAGYLTQGDAYDAPDQHGGSGFYLPHATSENIRGVVVASVPRSTVLGGLLGLLAALGLAGAAVYRRRLEALAARARYRGPRRRTAAIVLVAVLVGGAVFPILGGFAGVESDHSGIAAAAAGDKEWAYTTGDNVRGGSTAVVNGTVYVGSYDNNVYAIDADTGTEEWSYNTGGQLYSGPHVVNGSVYAGSRNGHVVSLDAHTGAVEWNVSVANDIIFSSPTYANGKVYIGAEDGDLHALDADTGAEEWASPTGGSVRTSPVIANGTVYVGSDSNNIYAFDAETGSEEWSYATADWPRGHPTVYNGTVFATDSSGYIYAIDTSSGTEEWSDSISSTATIRSAPTIYNETLYFGEDDNNALFAYDPETGAQKWFASLGTAPKRSGPSAVNGTIYIGDGSGDIHAFDETGTEEWSASPGTSDITAPTLVDGTIYVGSSDNNVYAVDAGDSTSTSEDSRVLYGTSGHHEELLMGTLYSNRNAGSGSDSTSGSSSSMDQSVGLVEDELGMFPPEDSTLVVEKRTTEYRPLYEAYSSENWRKETWEESQTTTFNWGNKTSISLEDGRHYRFELDSPYGTWQDSGFEYDAAEMSDSTIWLRPETGHLDGDDDGNADGTGDSGPNDGGSTDDGDSTPTETEETGFGPTALGYCTTLDGEDGVEVEYWDPDYSTYKLDANLSVDGSAVYNIYKEFDSARGYYRGCLADTMTENASDDRDTGFDYNATDGEGNVVANGSMSFSAPTFAPTGNAPSSTGERVGLLAAVLGALAALWFGGNRYLPASSVRSWPSNSINPAFGIGGPIVALLGFDMAGGGVISAGVATGLAQIAPFAGVVGVSIGGYYALRWIRAPPA